MKRFEDKVCFITGGTRGIGLAIAKRFGDEGATVVICSRREENLDEALTFLKGIKVDGHICDVGKKESRAVILKHIE
jgi:short-subunit dehydrogenase involved in D-alanine esterification of teichoic acids